MYYAMALIPKPIDEGKGCYIRSLKVSGFKNLEAAKQALLKKKCKGYVKKLGCVQSVYTVG